VEEKKMYTKPVAQLSVPALSLLLLVLTACSSGLVSETPPFDLEAQATSTTITVPVAANGDDAEEVNGSMQLSGKSLDFTTKTTVGLRFGRVEIPARAKVTRAYIQFKAITADSGAATLQLRGVASDNAAAFRSAAKNLSARGKTAAFSTWRPNAWTRGQTTRSSELASVVQEVVNRPGWQSGNALAFLVTNGGTSKRSASSREMNAATGPTLYVSFELPTEETAPEPEPEVGLGTLPDDSLETWNSRLVATITNPQYGIVYDAQYGYINNTWMNPVRQASSGDLYALGRNFNVYATSLILAYRESGDRTLMQQLEQLMELARDTLGDPNGDGFLNWRYQHYGSDSSSSPLLGDDYHEMDEMLTHTMVAAVAYALKQAGYGSSAAFWTDYLQNDFEAKWRKRKNKPSGFPFLTKDLMHTYVQWIRYHYYMGKLTGDSSYTREALRMAGVVRGNMRLTSTPGGSSYDWAHRVQLSGSGSLLGCQPMTYVKYTTQAFADLATQDSRLFDSTFMQGVASTMAYKAWKNLDGTQLANDICGGGTHGSLYYGASHPFTVLAAWDNSGILKEIAIRTYYATEQNREASPRVYNLPAMMVFTLGQ
jgi:hypothetical protein